MTEKRVTVDFDTESYYLDGEYWESWDNYGEEMADAINELLNKLHIQNCEQKHEIDLLATFLLDNGFTFEDFNQWFVNKHNITKPSTIKEVHKTDYCFNKCKYHNYYDGWCHYHDKDTCEIDYIHCEVNKG